MQYVDYTVLKLDRLVHKDCFRFITLEYIKHDMLRPHFFILILGFLAFSCADKNNNPSAQKSTGKVNAIKKETAPEAVKKVATTEDSTKEMTAVGASPEQLAKAATLMEAVDQAEIDKVNSKKIFKMHCSLCHGFKGDMMINGAKDLVKSRISLQEAVAQIYHGKGLMTPYKGVLSDTEIIAIAQYTETLRR